MRLIHAAFSSLALFSSLAFAQVSVPQMNVTGSMKVGAPGTADTSSAVEISSTTKGMLFPRMTTTQRDAISSPATGLLIFNTTTGVYNFYDGSTWGAIGANTLPNFTSGRVLIGDGTNTPSTNSGFTFSAGSVTATSFVGALTGNASTATALAANPTDCSSNQFANAIAANGNLTCAQPAFSNISGTLGISAGGTGQTTKAAAFDALAPTQSAGDLIVYGASGNIRLPSGQDNEVLTADSTQTNGVKWTSAPSSGTNYITDGEFKSGVSQVFTFDDGTSYVDGTGGSPTSVTVSLDTSNNLGINSLKVAKAASTCLGEGLSINSTTIAKRDAARGYLIAQFAYDFSTLTAGDWQLKAYDVTNSAILSVTPITGFNDTSSAGLMAASTTAYALVNIPTSTRQIRWSLYCNTDSTSASAKTAYVSKVELKPNQTSQGAIVTPWLAYTTNCSGSWSTNTTYTCLMRRVGDVNEFDILVSTSGAPTSAALTVNLPVTIDTSKQAGAGASDKTPLGTIEVLDGGNAGYFGAVDVSSSTSVRALVYSASGAYASSQAITQAVPFTFGSSDSVALHFKVPVLNQAASTTLSTQDINLQNPAGTPITATSSAKTPTASGNFQSMSGNSLTLAAGTWELNGSVSFLDGGTSAGYSLAAAGWYAANGADSSTQPALLSTASGLTIQSVGDPSLPTYLPLSGNSRTPIPPVTIKLTQSATIYLVPLASMTTAANARITAYLNAKRLLDFTTTGAFASPPTVSVVTATSHSGGFSANSSGTYTTPAGVRYIKVKMVGGGGGGSGSGATPGSLHNGSDSTFGTSLLTATGGAGTSGTAGADGSGGCTINSPATGNIFPGAGGGSSVFATSTFGATGGSTFLSGGGAGAFPTGTGGNTGRAAPSDGGGGGGGASSGSSANQGGGGGAGACGLEALISSPLPTYSFTVGAGGAGATAGTSGSAGGSGGPGKIVVEEYY